MRRLEAEIRAAWLAGDLARATTLTLEGYGPEVLGWLVAVTHDPAEADDAFATASEDLFRGFEAFRWECSPRAWLYTLARHALLRERGRAAARPSRRQPLGDVDVAASARAGTAPWLRTETKDAFAALRAALDEDERALLVLRVDRDLSWDEIAVILGEGGGPAKASARLRKRFQNIKEKLRALATAQGLLGGRS